MLALERCVNSTQTLAAMRQYVAPADLETEFQVEGDCAACWRSGGAIYMYQTKPPQPSGAGISLRFSCEPRDSVRWKHYQGPLGVP